MTPIDPLSIAAMVAEILDHAARHVRAKEQDVADLLVRAAGDAGLHLTR